MNLEKQAIREIRRGSSHMAKWCGWDEDIVVSLREGIARHEHPGARIALAQATEALRLWDLVRDFYRTLGLRCDASDREKRQRAVRSRERETRRCPVPGCAESVFVDLLDDHLVGHSVALQARVAQLTAEVQALRGQPLGPSSLKLCGRCRQRKPISGEFFVSATHGLQAWCRECKAEHARLRRRGIMRNQSTQAGGAL